MSMRRFLRRLLQATLLLLVLIATAAPFWFGLVPQRWSPFPPIALSQPANWFLDPRLAALRLDPTLCRAVLIQPYIEASPIADNPLENGCGWTNTVRTINAGGAKIPADKLSCEMAASLALWIQHDVQAAAQKHFGTKVTALTNFGTYSCRNIIGNTSWRAVRSQHATANAIDISSFTLADGRQISVLKNWSAPAAESAFLHEVHAKACRFFRASLSPNFNAAHKDHFHFDRGPLWTCR
jgi:hypothetical protein